MPDTQTAPAAAITLQTVNPAELGVLDQARADATPDQELIDSIRQHGIMQPPTVAFDPEHGGYVIVIGHRRVGAAIAVGLSEITVIVRENDVDPDALKLEQQIVENERRKALTPAELAQGYKKLELFGKTPAEIAAELGEKPDRVKAALTAVKSPAAATALAGGVDLEQAAIIAEFDDDAAVQELLVRVAQNQPQNFAREVATRRYIRAADAKEASLREQARIDGVEIVGEYGWVNDRWTGDHMSGYKGALLSTLGINRADHTTCPGYAAILSGISDASKAELVHVCTDWRANGHTMPTPAGFVELTDEQIAQRDIEAAERKAHWEAQEARRSVIYANTLVRREWLHGFLHTKLRPLASHIDVIAAATATQMSRGEWWPEHVIGHLLTGDTDTRWEEETVEAAFDDPAHPRLRLTLATALAVFETNLEDRHATVYWPALESWGYTLTDTDREHLAAATAHADEHQLLADGYNLDGDPREEDEDGAE